MAEFDPKQIKQNFDKLTPEQQEKVKGIVTPVEQPEQVIPPVEQPEPTPTPEPVQQQPVEPVQPTQPPVQQVQPQVQVQERVVEPAPVQTTPAEQAGLRFGYETTLIERQERNQNLAENFFKQSKVGFDEENLARNIKSIAPDVTDEDIFNTVNDIQQRFNRLKIIDDVAVQNSDFLANSVMDGTIDMGDLEALRDVDPQKYQEVKGLVTEKNNKVLYNQTLDSFKNVIEGKEQKTALTFLETINKNYSEALKATDGQQSLQSYQDAINDPELVEMRDNLSVKEQEIKEIDMEMSRLRDKVIEDNPGASKSLVNAIMQDKAAGLQRRKNDLLLEAQFMEQRVNNRLDNAKRNYEFDLAQENKAKEQVLQQYNMDLKTFDLGWNQLNKQLELQEKEVWRQKDLQDQVNLMRVKQNMQKDMARFGADLDRQEIAWQTALDGLGNTAFIDPSSGVSYGSYTNTDGAGQQQLKDLGNSLWMKARVTANSAAEQDWDIAGEHQATIPSPVNGTIKSLVKQPRYGNIQMIIEDESGYQVELNHLDPSTFDRFQGLVGQQIRMGQDIAVQGNTGNVFTEIGKGNRVPLRDISGNPIPTSYATGTAEQLLAKGKGGHLDVMMKDPNGNRLNGQEIQNYLQGRARQQPKQLDLPKIESDVSNLLINNTKTDIEILQNSIRNQLQSGDIEGLKRTMRTAYLGSLTQTEGREFREREAFIDDLEFLRENINDYIAGGGDLGIFRGSFESLAQFIGTTTDPKLAKLKTVMQNILDILARDRTGAALTESEERFYQRLVPGVGKSAQLSLANIDGLIELTTNQTQGRIDRDIRKRIGKETADSIYGKAKKEKKSQNVDDAIAQQFMNGGTSQDTSYLDNYDL